eukprot:1159890-Pelagomonas_calceolata.AAC.3
MTAGYQGLASSPAAVPKEIIETSEDVLDAGADDVHLCLPGYTWKQVETAGDCYIVSGGIMSPNQSENGFGLVVEDQDPAESAKRVMEFAKALLEAAKQVRMPDTDEPVRVRVGLHTGTAGQVVARRIIKHFVRHRHIRNHGNNLTETKTHRNSRTATFELHTIPIWQKSLPLAGLMYKFHMLVRNKVSSGLLGLGAAELPPLCRTRRDSTFLNPAA